ncbi:MAG: succinate dehydrogenase, cytochrome b556 subunit [candidate division Zixibacteria bacterium]|nr:succinate dehydrogenase, cytochrome b556 subunit [candidate division Zixibacteria bacterium]
MYQAKTGFFKTYKDEVSLNPDVGTWSWLLHRITGLILVLYAFMHFFALSSSVGGASTFDAWLSNLQTTLTHLLEIGLVAVVAFHLLNGLRITMADFFFLTKPHKTIFWIAMVIFVIFMVVTLIVFLPRAFSPHT